MNERWVHYGDHRFLISDPALTTEQILESVIELFPELRGATTFVDDNIIYFVSKTKQLQNQLDIENRNRKQERTTEKLLEQMKNIGHLSGTKEQKIRTGTIQAHQIATSSRKSHPNFFPDGPAGRNYVRGGMGNGNLTSFEKDSERTDKALLSLFTREAVSEYNVEILGKYAARGNYEHLVGKKAKIIEDNIDLEIYVIQVEDDDKQYVIRKKDIKKL